MMKTKQKFITALLCTTLISNGLAPKVYADARPGTESGSSQNNQNNQNNQTVIEVAKDIFFKGSIDGKHTWIVLGVEEGAKLAKDMLHQAVASDDLLAEFKDAIYTPEHHVQKGFWDDRRDIIGTVQESVENAQRSAPEILKSPWRSLEKIPNAFKVNLEQADDAYYHSDSKMIGSMKYSGWAVWTLIEGTYYLVVEAPLSSLGHTVETAAGIVFPPAGQTLKITYLSTLVVARFVAMPVAAAVTGSYSLVSSSTAALGSLLYAGGLAAFDGVKWVMYDYPRSYTYPVRVDKVTQIDLDKQELVANNLIQHWERKPGFKIKPQVGRYQSKLEILFEGGATVSEPTQFGVFWVYPENGKLKLRAEMNTAYIKALSKAENRSYKDTKNEMKAALNAELNEILAEATLAVN